MTRLQFLKWMGVSLAAATLPLGCNPFSGRRKIEGGMVNPAVETGHLLRKGQFPVPTETLNTKVVIIGAGISGLAAAWHLKKAGINDFLLLDLENEAGGNAASGQNETSAYPWGAHYLPLPDLRNTELLDFLTEIGVITGKTEDGMPVYRPEYLCQAPQERLYMHGIWQSSLVPQTGMSAAENQEFHEFFAFIEEMKRSTGEDGKPLFSIPLDSSSEDAATRALDQQSFAEFLQSKGWNSMPFRWYMDYCCKDDYGALARDVSAWAGIHYFAARTGKGFEAGESAVLTWPEGNGFLAQKLFARVKENFRGNALVYQATQSEQGAECSFFDPKAGKSFQVQAQKLIMAAPHFVRSRLMPGQELSTPLHHAPWVVANVTLHCEPGHNDIAEAWDSVAYGRESLGYINATQQKMSGFPGSKSQITWYHALAGKDPREARQEAFSQTWEHWKEMVVADLSYMHKDIGDLIERIEVRTWGHGMVAPVPGYIWGKTRQSLIQPQGNIHFAHTDLSGISLFEEGFYQGRRAAEEVLGEISVNSAS
ncbi:MAG: FAD-dependent oxidoreductase [Bacteroidia bacterium]|nr:FAD-dependent oxidoreductase [Bacteroidia bacterium]